MSYTINLTNGNVFAVIPDATINQSSSMTLIGKNYAGYGQFLDDNFIHLLENGANGTPPLAPLIGQLWFNTTVGALQVYNGSIFKALGGATVSATAPVSANSVTGDLWYDTVNQQVNVWSGSAWILVGPAYTAGTGITGAIPATIVDSFGTNHVVVELYAGATLVGLISKDATFTPQVPLSGSAFGTVSPGIQLATNFGNIIPTFTGTATNSLALNGLTSAEFMRSDAAANTTGNLSILNNTGLFVGAGSILNVSIANTDVNFKNSGVNGNINLGVNSSTSGNIPALIINGSTGVTTGANIIANNSTLFNNLNSTQFMRTDINTSTTGSIAVGSYLTATGNVYGASLIGNVLQVNNNATIAGNLLAQGTVNFTANSTIVANTTTLALSNNKATYFAANGTGISVGPAGAPLTGWTYSSAANSWVTNVGISAAGTINAANFNGNIVLPPGGNIFTTGTITGAQFYGDGSTLTNITGAAVVGAVAQATQLNTGAGGFAVFQSGSKLYFTFNGSTIASMDQNGNFVSATNITAYGSP